MDVLCIGPHSAAAAFAVLEASDAFIPYPIVSGPHAAVVSLLFATPVKPLQDTVIGVIGGHVVAAGMAVLQVKFLPAAAVPMAKTIVVALAVGAQKLSGAVHPPACGVAFVWATSGQDDPLKLIGPLIGCSIIIAVQQAWNAATSGKAKAA